MPTYEFTCKQCGNRFEIMVPIAKKADISCTTCNSSDLQEMYSVNVSKSSSKGSSCPQRDTCSSRGTDFG